MSGPPLPAPRSVKNYRGNWCCCRDSNSGPLPYQGTAPPLSYSSAGSHRAAGYSLLSRLDASATPRFPGLDAAAWRAILRPMQKGPPPCPAPDRTGPTLTDRALADKQARQARQAAALRANLRKRKEQSRAREAAEPKPDYPHELAGGY